MVFAELIIASYGLPVDITASFNYGWKMGKSLCLTTGFILTTTGKIFRQFLESFESLFNYKKNPKKINSA